MIVDSPTKSTEEILLILCKAVQKVLKKASDQEILFSPFVQTINKTCLKPDIGCFTIFEGGLSGLLIMNFSKEAALDIYRSYMSHMGIPEDELSILHTSDDVANVLGELMNQTMGHFQTDLRHELHVTVKQNQPKMLVVSKDISIAAQIEDPQYRRVSFETEQHKPFFLELALEKTEFELLFPYEKEKDEDVDEIFLKAKQEQQKKDSADKKTGTGEADDEFIKKMGL
ncbi:MAG: DUF3334 family protein [Desulfobacterium sp.]|nr:DUF3334 family protein [Desulfobacterium sp.]